MGAPSRWQMGVQWGTAAADPIEAFWGPVAAPTTRPVVYVSINNILQPTVNAASWRLGRDGWFSDLSPSSASISFAGPATGTNGDPVMIATETGLLWTGVLENISTSKRLSGGDYTSTVTAVDGLARHGLAEITDAIGATGYTYVTMVPFVMSLLGMDPLTITEGDPTGTLPSLAVSVNTLGMTLLEYIQILEKSSNALTTLQPDGSLLAVSRAPAVAASVPVLDLVGINAPRAWTVSTDKSSVINDWEFTDADGVNRLDETNAASVLLYGQSTYSITNYADDDIDHWSTALRTALATPRPIVTNGEFPIFDQDQDVLHLAPLDWISFDGDTWQVMSVEHSVTPGEWSVTITADVSQNTLGGTTDPPPGTDPPTVDTQTRTSTKSATVVLTPAGTEMGNGAGNYLPVGLYQGYRHRALIDFTTLAKPTGYISVKSAKLNLRTTGQEWVAFGSKPKFYARRITSSWTEGTYDAAPTSQYSVTNSVVWPGPSRTSTGQTLKTIGRTEDNEISVDVTDIIQRAFDLDSFNGIMLMSANEDSSANTIEFCSDDHGTVNARPELVVKCYVT